MRASQVHTAAHLRLSPVRGMSLGMPREQDMVVGQRLRDLTGYGNYFEWPRFLKTIARRHYDGRPHLADAVGICHFRPNDLAEAHRCGHRHSPQRSKRLWLISIKPGLRRRRCLHEPVPIKLRDHALGLLPGKQVL